MRSRRARVAACLPSRRSPYRAALPGYRYEFPRDHFNHPEFQTEWWYYTGNLRASDGRRFGFELTFFRQGVDRGSRARRRLGCARCLAGPPRPERHRRQAASFMPSGSTAPARDWPERSLEQARCLERQLARADGT